MKSRFKQSRAVDDPCIRWKLKPNLRHNCSYSKRDSRWCSNLGRDPRCWRARIIQEWGVGGILEQDRDILWDLKKPA